MRTVKRFVFGILFVLVTSCAGMAFFGSNKPKSNEKTEINTPPSSVSADTPTEIPPADEYRVQSYKGHIAVFQKNNPEPVKTFGVAVKDLPLADQNILNEGIDVIGQDHLNALLEDYCS